MLHECEPPAVAGGDPYSDRIRDPAETLDRMRPHFPALGITRLARQTGLDRLGIPCFAAIRPNARTLAANQGKGLSDAAAMASAVMEASEFAIAENPGLAPRRASRRALHDEGLATEPMAGLYPAHGRPGEDEPIDWVEGRNIFSGAPVWVPYDAVLLDHVRPGHNGMARTSNGLASGNVRIEALFHGLCELVERDGATLLACRGPATVAARALHAEAFADPHVSALAERVAEAGLALTLFDLTSDLGLPIVRAVIGEPGRAPRHHFDFSSGSGCHPVAARAALRAITEAAQSRITLISGARDDFAPESYLRSFSPQAAPYLLPPVGPGAKAPAGLPLGTPLVEALAHVERRLLARGIDNVIALDMGGAEFGIAVVKLLAPQLEDRSANRNWRPGRRAANAMLTLW